MLTNIEKEVGKIGIHINVQKIEIISINHNTPVKIELENCSTQIKNVTNFKYLGAWLKDSQNDFEIRKAQAWSTIHKMLLIWISKMGNQLKIRTFKATIEPILLYGSKCWIIESMLLKIIDGCYTSLLRIATNASWKEKLTNTQLYKGMPTLSTIQRYPKT